MMNYKVQPTGSWTPAPTNPRGYVVAGEFTYEVVENGTRQVIKTDLSHNQAKALCRHLNFGGGFDGWTPPFFLQKIALSEDNG